MQLPVCSSQFPSVKSQTHTYIYAGQPIDVQCTAQGVWETAVPVCTTNNGSPSGRGPACEVAYSENAEAEK
jgi:hypothetical protein